MANTRSATLSIRLKPATKRRLAKLAEAFLISDAVECYVADQERMLAEMRQADRQVKSGHYIRHEDMKAWLLSWGTDREFPPPRRWILYLAPSPVTNFWREISRVF